MAIGRCGSPSLGTSSMAYVERSSKPCVVLRLGDGSHLAPATVAETGYFQPGPESAEIDPAAQLGGVEPGS